MIKPFIFIQYLRFLWMGLQPVGPTAAWPGQLGEWWGCGALPGRQWTPGEVAWRGWWQSSWFYLSAENKGFQRRWIWIKTLFSCMMSKHHIESKFLYFAVVEVSCGENVTSLADGCNNCDMECSGDCHFIGDVCVHVASREKFRFSWYKFNLSFSFSDTWILLHRFEWRNHGEKVRYYL